MEYVGPLHVGPVLVIQVELFAKELQEMVGPGWLRQAQARPTSEGISLLALSHPMPWSYLAIVAWCPDARWPAVRPILKLRPSLRQQERSGCLRDNSRWAGLRRRRGVHKLQRPLGSLT